MNTPIVKGGTDTFAAYLSQYKDQVKPNSIDGYYHVDIVAEAYNQGFQDGEKSGKKDFLEDIMRNRIETFTQKANQVYILAQNLISFLQKNNFIAIAFYINLQPDCPKVIIAVPGEQLLNDGFVVTTYSRIHEMKKIFSELFNQSLDMGLMSADELDAELLKEDGFGYSEKV